MFQTRAKRLVETSFPLLGLLLGGTGSGSSEGCQLVAQRLRLDDLKREQRVHMHMYEVGESEMLVCGMEWNGGAVKRPGLGFALRPAADA